MEGSEREEKYTTKQVKVIKLPTNLWRDKVEAELSNIILYLKDLLGSLLHARPHLVAETPQRVKLQDGVDALAGFLVMQLGHHHFGHCVGDLYRTQEEHGGWRGLREGGWGKEE